jgi:hypothetical protein
MKKLLLGLVLSVVAIVAAPVATASAAEASTFEVVGAEGSCKISGKAKFTPALNVVLKKRKYEFTSTTFECETSAGTEKRVAKVKGEAEVSCEIGEGEGEASVEYKFTAGLKETDLDEGRFEFKAVLNRVKFKVTGKDANGEPIEAEGEAEFEAAELAKCEVAGAAELEFKATVKKGSKL